MPPNEFLYGILKNIEIEFQIYSIFFLTSSSLPTYGLLFQENDFLDIDKGTQEERNG